MNHFPMIVAGYHSELTWKHVHRGIVWFLTTIALCFVMGLGYTCLYVDSLGYDCRVCDSGLLSNKLVMTLDDCDAFWARARPGPFVFLVYLDDWVLFANTTELNGETLHLYGKYPYMMLRYPVVVPPPIVVVPSMVLACGLLVLFMQMVIHRCSHGDIDDNDDDEEKQEK